MRPHETIAPRRFHARHAQLVRSANRSQVGLEIRRSSAAPSRLLTHDDMTTPTSPRSWGARCLRSCIATWKPGSAPELSGGARRRSLLLRCAPKSVGATTSGDLRVACGRWHGARSWIVEIRASAHQRCRHRRTALMPARVRRFLRFPSRDSNRAGERLRGDGRSGVPGQGAGDADGARNADGNILDLRIRDQRSPEMGPWHEHQGCASVATPLMRRSSASTGPATCSVPPSTGHL